MAAENAKILVVDDDRSFARSLGSYLSALGYSVQLASNGRDALDQFAAGSFDLVFTDLNMPGMSGLELLAKIKSIDPQAIVVVITGSCTDNSAASAIKKGAYDFLTKPVRAEELELVVDRVVERRGLLRQVSVFRGVTLALVLSIPVWLAFGIIIAIKLF